MKKRAIRRHHAKRMKAKAKRLGYEAKLADHLAWCSCEACGNPRRHHGMRTVQELRFSMPL